MSLKRSDIMVGAAVLAVGGTIFWLEHRALRTARAQNEDLRRQVSQLMEQVQAQQRRSDGAVQAREAAVRPEEAQRELDRLRGEAGARRPTEELAKLREQNRRLQVTAEEPTDPVEAEFKAQTIGHVNNLKVWGLDFRIYASQHEDQLPESWEQALAVSQKRAQMKDAAAFAAYMRDLTNQFELVYRGTLKAIPNPGETLIFMEKQPRLSPKGEWVKVYGFADGSVLARTQPEEDFKAWEQQRVFKAR